MQIIVILFWMEMKEMFKKEEEDSFVASFFNF